MSKSDFYLAAAALIPLLRLMDLAGQGGRVVVNFKRVETAQRIVKNGDRIIGMTKLAWLAWWAYYGWAEWICLRSLETGHSPWGGATVIWIALAFLLVQGVASGFDFVPAIQGFIAPDTSSNE